jgi:hypothetical protein
MPPATFYFLVLPPSSTTMRDWSPTAVSADGSSAMPAGIRTLMLSSGGMREAQTREYGRKPGRQWKGRGQGRPGRPRGLALFWLPQVPASNAGGVEHPRLLLRPRSGGARRRAARERHRFSATAGKTRSKPRARRSRRQRTAGHGRSRLRAALNQAAAHLLQAAAC